MCVRVHVGDIQTAEGERERLRKNAEGKRHRSERERDRERVGRKRLSMSTSRPSTPSRVSPLPREGAERDGLLGQITPQASALEQQQPRRQTGDSYGDSSPTSLKITCLFREKKCFPFLSSPFSLSVFFSGVTEFKNPRLSLCGKCGSGFPGILRLSLTRRWHVLLIWQ